MAKRPEGMDVETWRAQRAAHYKRINRTLNLLMLVAIGLLLWRYLKS
jgi:hypothetical protein